MGDEWKWNDPDKDEVLRYALDAWREEYENMYDETNIKIRDTNPNQITMMASGTEMLRVADDGFYVRGVRVEADEKEAKTVYEAFKAFLAWSELGRR